MGPLTENRAKPALPFAGLYRLIDFPLSNCANSGISDVWVLQQYQPFSIEDHLANGRPWDLDRTSGGLLILQPFTGGRAGHLDLTIAPTGSIEDRRTCPTAAVIPVIGDGSAPAAPPRLGDTP